MANYNYKLLLSDLLESGESIDKADRKAASEIIGKRALELMKSDLERFRSPVSGTPFKALKNKDYQKVKGTSRSNLKLSGDLYAGLEDKAFNYGAKLSIKGSKNKLKAENHLKRDQSGNEIPEAAESKTGVRQRKFFPTGDESLRPGIKKQLRDSIKELIKSK